MTQETQGPVTQPPEVDAPEADAPDQGMTQKVFWEYPPIVYSRPSGWGMICGKYIYAYAADGTLESLSRLTWAILDPVMRGCFPTARSMQDVEDILNKVTYDVTAGRTPPADPKGG